MTNKQNTPPNEGEHWQGHGGIYVGTYRDGDKRYHLIVADTPESKLEGEWGKYGEEIEDEFSFVDGEHNTQLILAAEPDNPIAKSIRNLVIEGHNDFHWPAQKQLMLCYINAQHLFDQTWHWSSTQYSASGAWGQGFGDGCQVIDGKDDEHRTGSV